LQPGGLLIDRLAEYTMARILQTSHHGSHIRKTHLPAIGEVKDGIRKIRGAAADHHHIHATGVALPEVRVRHVPADQHPEIA
jgi:hypothetical protein